MPIEKLNTQKSVNVRKASSLTILALLALSALLVFIPGVVNATITGDATLGGANSLSTPTEFTPATTTINVTAGSDAVSDIAGTTCVSATSCITAGAEVFAINFTGVGFSTNGFWLYMSPNVEDNINPSLGDIEYAGPFTVSSVHASSFTEYGNFVDSFTGLNETFYAGKYLLTGPLPLEINSSDIYIKIYDGGCGAPGTFTSCTLGTSIAEPEQSINVQPGIVVSPDGMPVGLPAGTPVTVYGGGFTSGDVVNITYSFPFTSWVDTKSCTGPSNTCYGTLAGPITVPHDGIFSKAATMADTKQSYNLKSASGTFPFVSITLWAYKPNVADLWPTITGVYNYAQEQIAPPVFNETTRVFNQVASYQRGVSTPYEQDNFGVYGNDTGYQNDLYYYGTATHPLNVYIYGSIGIAGNYQYYDTPIKVTISNYTGTLTIAGSQTTSNATGYYSLNVTVPIITAGAHTVFVSTDSVNYTFSINVLPTLILSPSSGPTSGCNGSLGTTNCSPGGTRVTVTAYGFPASATIWVYWYGKLYEESSPYWNLVNTTTSSNGELSPASFNVPSPTYGGDHYVYAVSNITEAYPGNRTDDIGTFVSSAPFYVEPSLVASPSTINSNVMSPINSNSTGFINVSVEGLAPYTSYLIQIDHSFWGTITGEVDYSAYLYNGNGEFNFTAAGFSPGVHQVELTPMQPYYDYGAESYNYGGCFACVNSYNYTGPAAWTYFNVTTNGDYISNEINGIASSVTNSVNNALASWTTTLNNIQTAVTTNIPNDITTSQAAITTAITQAQTAIAGDITNAQTAITNAINSAQTSLSSAIANVQSTANTASSEATQAANNSSSASSGASTAQTYVLVVAVLAAITLVLELAILVRKLS